MNTQKIRISDQVQDGRCIKNIAESREVIKNVFQGKECYAVCEKETDRAIGAIELKLNGSTDMTEQDNECELGYWLGKPFWGRGYIPEAAEELICHGFPSFGIWSVPGSPFVCLEPWMGRCDDFGI